MVIFAKVFQSADLSQVTFGRLCEVRQDETWYDSADHNSEPLQTSSGLKTMYTESIGSLCHISHSSLCRDKAMGQFKSSSRIRHTAHHSSKISCSKSTVLKKKRLTAIDRTIFKDELIDEL